MLPVKRRRKVVFKRQRPLLYTHRMPNSGVAAKPTPACDWGSLPVLVLVGVFQNLSSPVDRCSVGLVCRHWKKSMNDPRLWRASLIYLPAVSKLRSQHWSLLQSRWITKLSLAALLPPALTRTLKKMATSLPNLQYIALDLLKRDKKAVSYNLNGLSDFSNLRELVIFGSSIAITIPNLPLLKGLVLHNKLQAKFSRVLPSLESLAMELDSNGSIHLEYFPRLKSLSLPKSGLNCGKLTSGEPYTSPPGERVSFPCIEHLNVSYSQLNLGGRRFFKQFPNLRYLNVAHCSLSEWDLLIIVKDLTQLRELDLTGNETTDSVLSNVSAPLVSLTVQRSIKVTGLGLRGLSNTCCHSLSSLDLSFCTAVTPSFLPELETLFPKLTTLHLRGWILTENENVLLEHYQFKTIL